MFGKAIPLFTVFGFQVRLDWSWFIIAVLVTWSLATGLFPNYYENLSTGQYWSMGVAGALGLFVSIVLHELGHALEARRHGLNMSGITLFIFGGVAEMTDEPPSPKAEFLVAIAGPIVSILLAGAFYGLDHAGQAMQWPNTIVGVLWYLALINALLVGFNMIPAFPLDGGRILRSALWAGKKNLRWATRITSQIGAGFGLFMILMGVFSVLGGNFIGGMWWFLLGLFLRHAANMSYQQLLIRRNLEGEPVSRFMQSDVHTVPGDISVRDLVDEHVYRHHYKMFPVVDDGRLRGCVTTRQIREVPQDRWSQMSVDQLAEPCTDANTIAPDADAMEALSRMSRTDASRLLVVDDGELRGILTLKDLLAFIRLKVELEDDEQIGSL